MEQSRTSKAFRNGIVGIVCMFASLVVSFFTKSVFIHILGTEFNGLNSLFSDILTMLNLAELGFASSIAYALYKPLERGDEREIASIMNYFARVYRIIAGVVLVVGLALIPALPYFIKEDLSTLPYTLAEIRVYYVMFLVNTVCTYLLAYKRTIITADQNSFLISVVDNTGNILLNVLQIVLLLVTHNYFAFLGTMIAKTVLDNLIIHIVASKKYKYLLTFRRVRITRQCRREILGNVLATMVHNLGTVAVTGTASIVISALVGINQVGMYSNYMLVVGNINSFVTILFTSMTASIGSLCVERSAEEQYIVFRRINYFAVCVGAFCFSCFVALLQPFIEIWIGGEHLLPMSTVLVICLDALIFYLRRPVGTFKAGKGMFRQDCYKPVLEAIFGLSISIGLSYVWGMTGIILGYVLAAALVALPIETYVLFRQGFGRSPLPHLGGVGCSIVFAALVAFVNYFVVSMIGVAGVGGFVLKVITSVAVSIVVIVGFSMHTAEFKYFSHLISRAGKVVLGKIKRGR